MRIECRRSRRRSRNQAGIPRVHIARTFGPSTQGIPKRSEPVAVVKWNGLNTPMLPKRGGLAAIPFLKSIQPASTTGTQIQRFEQILYGWIISGIAHEDNLK